MMYLRSRVVRCRTWFLACVTASLLCAFPISSSVTVIIEDISFENSWSVTMTGGLTFDTLEAFIVFDTGAGPFDPPGFGDFSDASWSGEVVNPNYALGTGNSVNLLWTTFFAGDFSEGLTVDYFAWSGGVFGTQRLAFQIVKAPGEPLDLSCVSTFVAQECTTFDARSQEYDREHSHASVPESSTLSLFSIALAGLGWVGRRQKET